MISDERLKRFWKWCGLKGVEVDNCLTATYIGRNGSVFSLRLTLDTLFRSAVPKVLEEWDRVDGLSVWQGGKGWVWELCEAEGAIVSVADHKDIAIALFLAIEKLIEEVT